MPITTTAHGTHRSSPPSQGVMKLIAQRNKKRETTMPRTTVRRTTSTLSSVRHPLIFLMLTIGIRNHQSPRRDGNQPGSFWFATSSCFGQIFL